MPKVSIVLPNYNHARFLLLRIESILNQSFQDFELIILDDASTDNSRAVIESYTDDARIRCVFNSENSGSPYKQWNKGVQLAKGEYVWIAESDDIAEPDFLEKTVAILEEQANVGLVYTQSMEIDENNQPQGLVSRYITHSDQSHWQKDFITDGIKECQNHLIFQNTIPNASAVFFRKTLFEESGYVDESMRLCADWLIWVKMLSQSQLAYLSEPLNNYRFHSGTVRSSTEKQTQTYKETYRVLTYIKSLDPERDVLEKAYEKFAKELYWNVFNRKILNSDCYQLLKKLSLIDSMIFRRMLRLKFLDTKQKLSAKML